VGTSTKEATGGGDSDHHNISHREQDDEEGDLQKRVDVYENLLGLPAIDTSRPLDMHQAQGLLGQLQSSLEVALKHARDEGAIGSGLDERKRACV
jgi:hypothetical protein